MNGGGVAVGDKASISLEIEAILQLTAEEAAGLGPLLRALTAALREVLGCSKTYVALFAEAEGFAHVH